MSLTNTSKPATSFSNVTKVSFGELWSTITSTWASETRTWLASISLFTNISLPRTFGEYTFDEIGTDTIDSHIGERFDQEVNFITNTSKPA